ncbi:hypothetical protein JW777_00725 [bacterium]|nr:hypothetical protein [bacterium]
MLKDERDLAAYVWKTYIVPRIQNFTAGSRLAGVRLVTWSFCLNRWVWFHILLAAMGARFFLSVIHMPRVLVFEVVVGIAIVWEMIEVAIDDVKAVYGSRARWVYDSIGDVLGAAAAALIVVLP